MAFPRDRACPLSPALRAEALVQLAILFELVARDDYPPADAPVILWAVAEVVAE